MKETPTKFERLVGLTLTKIYSLIVLFVRASLEGA